DAEAPEVRDGVRGVDLLAVTQLVVPALGEHPPGQPVHVVGRDDAEVALGDQAPVDAQDRRRARLEVEVRRAALDAGYQEPLEIDRHPRLSIAQGARAE